MAMMNLNKEAPERQDIETLLPWHAAGTLSRRDSDRVERALASDRELARRYQLVREELNETIHLNESLGAPSARCMEKLFAAIDVESPAVRKRSFDIVGRLVEFMSSFSPRTLAWSATAAVVAIMLQAAVLTTIMVRDPGASQGHNLASEPNGEQLAIVRFLPGATVADVTRFLDANQAVVVHGPKRGFYEIRISTSRIPDEEFMRIIQRMRAESRIIEFIAVKS
jgi:hypothetical protein